MIKGTVLYAGLPEISADRDQYFAEWDLSQSNSEVWAFLSLACLLDIWQNMSFLNAGSFGGYKEYFQDLKW